MAPPSLRRVLPPHAGRAAFCLAAAAAVLAACNGRLLHEDCSGQGTSPRSAFCDAPDGGGEDPGAGDVLPEYPPGFDSAAPLPCRDDLVTEKGDGGCPAPGPVPARSVGDPCTSAMECPDVCCVRGEGTQPWSPVPDASDASTDGAGDGGDDGGRAVSFDATRAHACNCGRCPTPAEICARLPFALGGP